MNDTRIFTSHAIFLEWTLWERSNFLIGNEIYLDWCALPIRPGSGDDGDGSWKVVCISPISSHLVSLFTVLLIGYKFCLLHEHKPFSAPQMILFSACCICGLIGGILNFQFVRALNKRPDSMHSIHLAAMTLACLGKQNMTEHNAMWCNTTVNVCCMCIPS